jgi:phage terminase large subunit GpA-like protein
VQFPTIESSKASGAIIRVAGITGRIRGMSAKRACDGRKARPSLVLIDDPQTDESAASPSQVATREAVLKGAILGLAGPGKKISGLCTVTVVKPDDLADRLLDRSRHPAWQGERMRLVYDWPKAEDLWAQYAELRRDGQRTGRGTADATEFYRERRAEMDAGARVGWEARKNDDELSALQHAYNLRIDRGESAFAAEYQNEPVVEHNESGRLTKRDLESRATNVPRGVVPLGHDTLTAFIDVQEKLLYWLVASWSQSFGGHVVAYGTYPDQSVSFFEASHAKRTLALAANGAGFEASLSAGLEAATVALMGREWKREDGAAMRVRQLLVDANWGQSTTTVRTFARRSAFAASILPSHGRGIGASGQPLTDKGKTRGDRMGLHWRIGQVSAGQRSALYDTNWWKTFVAARLRLPFGDPEAIALCAGQHELLAEHLTAEFPVRTEARGRVVDEWKTLCRDNHWLDCLVGSAVAASIAGLSPAATETATRQRRRVELPKGGGGKITVRRRAV